MTKNGPGFFQAAANGSVSAANALVGRLHPFSDERHLRKGVADGVEPASLLSGQAVGRCCFRRHGWN